MWPVLLTLYFLSPLFAEILSGSTPPLLFIQPFGFIFIPLLYGSSAILIREILVRRLLGWGNALVLGAAFGVFQEALVVQTWYNFMAKSSPSHQDSLYGVSLGTNWVWALNLTIYHAVISITLPLILLGAALPPARTHSRAEATRHSALSALAHHPLRRARCGGGQNAIRQRRI